MTEDEDRYDEFIEVPLVLVKQAIGAMSFDAKRGYNANATRYADIRHGTGRALADFTEMDWTDYPEIGGKVPPELVGEGPEEDTDSW